MGTWLDELAGKLSAAGVPTRTWQAGAGRLLLTVQGARVLGCEMPGVDQNVFWHSPSLLKARAGAAPVVRGAVGGDRLWIGPEIAYMWTDLKQARMDASKSNVLDAQMDPGEWRVEIDRVGLLRLATQMRLTDHRNGRDIKLNVVRQFSVAEPPKGLAGSVRALALAIDNQAAVEGGNQGAVASLWDLLQVPPRGTLVCPTSATADEPRSYYSPFGEKHVQADEDAVRFLIDGGRKIKLGLPAEATTGRMGYYRPMGEVACLIVRTFSPEPGEPYVDLPRDSDEVFGGDCLQAYNDDGRFGGFGEMEYHEPALVVGQGPTSRAGRSDTYVLVGPDAEVRAVGEQLLEVEVAAL